jgi:hypothetical protein
VILPALVAAVAVTLSGGVDQSAFRYARPLDATANGPVEFEPDARMYGHARVGFPDLRILDAEGNQVPWRTAPTPAAVPSRPVAVVARGRRNGTVTVVLDRGAVHPVIDRAELEIPDMTFVGRVVVSGSTSGAEGTYARLATTQIYAVHGAVDARSTTAVFPATDYRYLLVRATGVSAISGARVAREPGQSPLEPVASASRSREQGQATVVRLDLGFPKVPVDAVRVESTTPSYVRVVRIEGSNDGTSFVTLAQGRVARFPGVALTDIGVDAQHRFLRMTIENGDDAPLEGLRVTAEARARPLLLSEGYPPPYRLLYGAANVSAPEYDFEQLPAAATGVGHAVVGTLGAEAVNDAYEAPSDSRTFLERNGWITQALLVAAALVAAVAGLVALRRRT